MHLFINVCWYEIKPSLLLQENVRRKCTALCGVSYQMKLKAGTEEMDRMLVSPDLSQQSFNSSFPVVEDITILNAGLSYSLKWSAHLAFDLW